MFSASTWCVCFIPKRILLCPAKS